MPEASAQHAIFDQRRAGVLLHPTSLPAGTIGADARRFVDFLVDAGFSVWQVLPLGPVDKNNSPYQLRSAFAGNTALIDPLDLTREPWWLPGDAPRSDLMPQSWAHFRRLATDVEWADFTEFRKREAAWVVPYALFTILHAQAGGQAWWDWPEQHREPHPDVTAGLLAEHMPALNAVMFGQYLFDRQWRRLRKYATERGVYLFGDLPFYVDHDSADVWWRRHVFRLNADGQPTSVAGVPPDYFSADGQWWGNPLYNWEALRAERFGWWLARLAHQARLFDLLRVDHFRALESCWSIPSDAENAQTGHWEPVPGGELLQLVREQLPDLALVAEDLGTITPAVTELREQFGLPGMLILQFAFDGSPENPYLPENHVEQAVVYTGTHDNDTVAGWYASLEQGAREYVDSILGTKASAAAATAAMVRAAYASRTRLAILPLQDLLGLGSEARMNRPGTVGGNWEWRFNWDQLKPDLTARCLGLAREHGRQVDSITHAVEEAVV